VINAVCRKLKEMGSKNRNESLQIGGLVRGEEQRLNGSGFGGDVHHRYI
jgi:hypothetical protein